MTKFARIVVTDDRGRYVIPGLPTANYMPKAKPPRPQGVERNIV